MRYIAVLVALLCLCTCAQEPEWAEGKPSRCQPGWRPGQPVPEWSGGKPDIMARKMVFIRHPKVLDLCFAYMWEGGADGGPVSTTVPCDKVAHLIGVPKEGRCQ